MRFSSHDLLIDIQEESSHLRYFINQTLYGMHLDAYETMYVKLKGNMIYNKFIISYHLFKVFQIHRDTNMTKTKTFGLSML